jgi:hypothetical protein
MASFTFHRQFAGSPEYNIAPLKSLLVYRQRMMDRLATYF